MKKLLTIILFGVTSLASAELCTTIIKDKSGVTVASFTLEGDSLRQACNYAWDRCADILSSGQTYGMYQGLKCELSATNPTEGHVYFCQTDLIDSNRGITKKIFTASGSGDREACGKSDKLCRSELNAPGYFCEPRGLIADINKPHGACRLEGNCLPDEGDHGPF